MSYWGTHAGREHGRLILRFWAQRFGRLLTAVAWTCQLGFRYRSVRRQIRQHLGRTWLEQQLPAPPLSTWLGALSDVSRAAWRSSAERSAQQQLQHWRDVLQKLETNPWPRYRLNTVAGRKVYLAALQRCLQAICRQPLAATTFQSLHGAVPSAPTGLMAYLAHWLRERLALHPQLLHPKVAGLAPAPADDPVKQLEYSAQTSSRVQQFRREYWELHAATRSRLAEQEMQCRMIDLELRILAVPMAILTASQAQHDDANQAADSRQTAERPSSSSHQAAC